MKNIKKNNYENIIFLFKIIDIVNSNRFTLSNNFISFLNFSISNY